MDSHRTFNALAVLLPSNLFDFKRQLRKFAKVGINSTPRL